MKIVYDISALGIWHKGSAGKRGIYRVVHSIFDALMPNCDISLSSTENSHLAEIYLQSRPDLNQLLFQRNWIHTKLGHISDELEQYRIKNFKNDTAKLWLSQKFSGWAARHTGSVAQKLASFHPDFNLRDTNIFHQPGRFKIPDFIRNYKRNGFARFMTVYDFIPFSEGGMASHESASLRMVFDSLTKDDFLICISNYVKDEACERLGFPASQVFVAPLAASKNIFYACNDLCVIGAMRADLGLGNSPYFLTLCALDPRKNMRKLIDAFGLLCKEQPEMEANLVLAGGAHDHEIRSLLNYIAELGIAGRVILTGYVPDNHLAALYSGALAFVFPSLAEGFGLPPLEAMQCGTPVISSDLTSLPEVVGESGILVNPNDIDALGESMLELYRDEGKRGRLSAMGLERAAMFTWDKCASDHLAAYSLAID